MGEKIRKNIHIEILNYAHEHSEFLCRKLVEDLNFNQNEKQLFFEKLINEKTLLQNLGRNQKTKVGEESVFTISTEGRFKLLEYEQLKNANETSATAIKTATTSIRIAYVMVVIAIATFFVSQSSLEKARQSLELSSIPEITLNVENKNLNNDELTLPGYNEIIDSKAAFILKNNFLGKIKDIDIRMILLEMHRDPKSKHPVICPFGFIDFTHNPNFIVRGNLSTDSILDNGLYDLEPLEKKIFTINYQNMNEILNLKNGSNLFTKVDVQFKREIDNKQFQFSKIYKMHILTSVSGRSNSGTSTREYLVDTDIDKKIVGYIDKENEILSEADFSLPFIVYPFKEQSFVETVKSSIAPPYSLEQSECEIFDLNKKVKSIE